MTIQGKHSETYREEQVEKCGDCIYYLPHNGDGYNCGYLIKRVEQSRKCCKYYCSRDTSAGGS